MASTKKIPKVAVYKRAHFTKPTPPLQDLLHDVITKAAAEDIEWKPSETSDIRRLVNRTANREGCFCFEFLQFEAGKDQLLLTKGKKQKHYPIASEPVPPAPNGLPREIVESALFGAVYKNHLALVQTSALKSDALETYLLWLLNDRFLYIPEGGTLGLLDEPTAEAKRAVRKDPIKKITFGEGLTFRHAGNSGQKRDDAVELSEHWTGLPMRVLEAVLGEKELNNFLSAKKILDPENIKVKVEVSYVRKTDDNGTAVLNALAQAGRHADENQCSIILKGGSEIHGKDLKLKGEIRVESQNNIPFAESMFNEISNWLISQVRGTVNT